MTMSDTPRTDEFANALKPVPWNGNETQGVIGSVLALFVQWRVYAEGLERELYSEMQGHADIARLAEETRDPERPPRPGLSQKFVDRVTSEPDDEPPAMGSGLAKSAHEAARMPPPPNRSSAPNPKNARKKKR